MNNNDDVKGFGNASIVHDARQKRADLLTYWLGRLTEAQYINNFGEWISCLWNLYIICSPYVAEKITKELKRELEATDNIITLCKTSQMSSSIPLKKLRKTTESLLRDFKDQFMKTDEDESEEFDEGEAVA